MTHASAQRATTIRTLLFLSLLFVSIGCADVEIADYDDSPIVACVGEDIADRSSVSLTNDGSTDILQTFNVAFYLSSDETWDPADLLLLGGRDTMRARWSPLPSTTTSFHLRRRQGHNSCSLWPMSGTRCSRATNRTMSWHALSTFVRTPS